MGRRRIGVLEIYRRLRRAFGHAGWWPGRSAFEVCVGAILTQNTAWSNVEKALGELRSRRLLSYRGLRGLSVRELAPLIRSSGTYRVKARRLAAFVRFLQRWLQPTGWATDEASADEIAEIVALLEEQLDEGGLGIGMGLAYTPGASEDEVRAVFELARRRDVPVFAHIRGQQSPTDTEPIESILAHVRATWASLHVFHVTSSAGEAQVFQAMRSRIGDEWWGRAMRAGGRWREVRIDEQLVPAR